MQRALGLPESPLCVFELSYSVEWHAVPLICTWKSKHIPDLSLFSQRTLWCRVGCTEAGTGLGSQVCLELGDRLLCLIKGDLKIGGAWSLCLPGPAEAKPG